MENYKEKHKSHMATCHSPLQKCRSINPLMETMKKKHEAYTVHCRSPFAEV